MKSRWLEHQGKRILLADYSEFWDDSDGIYAEGQNVIREMQKEPEHSVLVIIDAHGIHASLANSAAFKKILTESSKYVRRRAVIGLNSSTQHFVNTLLNLTGRGSLTPFDSLEKALDWIVQE